MKNENQILKAAFNLAASSYKIQKNTFSQYSPIYLASTSNVKSTLALYQNYHSVLSVGSTGAHAYEAMLNGATKIDLFDINELQKLYFEFMKTAIIILDYKTFVKHFTLTNQRNIQSRYDIKDLLSNDLYEELVHYLPEEVERVFTPLYDYYDSPDLVTSALFRFEYPITLDYLKRYISFYNEEEYYKLQQILRSDKCSLNYEIVSLNDVPKHFSEKYDLIVLDNILQYYKDIPGLETPYAVNMFIRKKLKNLLKEDGTIQVNYGYEIATDALKSKLNNMSFNTENLSKLNLFALKEELKEGINIPLIEKWDDYNYSFVPGVSIEVASKRENLVLSYPKNASTQKVKKL